MSNLTNEANIAELLEKTLQSIDEDIIANIRIARTLKTHPAGIVFNGILVYADTRLEGTGASPDDVVKLAQLIWEKATP